MLRISRTNSCCGVREIEGLDVKYCSDIIRAVHEGIVDHNLNGAFYWFADSVMSGNGRKLADYINKYELGELTEIERKYNPQSRRQLEMWVWSIDVGLLRGFVGEYGQDYKDPDFDPQFT